MQHFCIGPKLCCAQHTCLLALACRTPVPALLPPQVHLLDAQDVSAPPICVQRRQPGLEYFVEHHKGHLLLLTNHSPMQQQQQQPTSPHHPLIQNADQLQLQQQQPTQQQRGQQEQKPPDSSAADYSLYTIPVAALQAGASLQQWRLLRAEVPGAAVTDMDVFDGCVVLHTLHDSKPTLLVLTVDTGTEGVLAVTQQHEVRAC